jgi:hypothetical protein
MKVLQGYPINISSAIIGKVSMNKYALGQRKNRIYVAEKLGRGLWGFTGVVTAQDQNKSIVLSKKPAVVGLSLEDLCLLQESDLIILEPSGRVTIAWDSDSPHNSILVTNSCNCK